MQIDTRYTPLNVTNATNVTTASITDPVPTLTAPTGDGVIDMGWATKKGVVTPGALLSNAVKLIPFGAGSDDNTFTMNVYCWDQTVPGSLWVPTILATFTCTLGTTVGIAGADIADTSRFCDTIALVVGNANVSVEVLSDTSNRIGHIILDAKGAAILECRFGTGSSATNCNCAYKRL